ncbi:2-dehydro-3-deoxy-6-phosphogalactonate aldolase (plasmid) [Paracoccus sp. TD-10]|uniref:2-dehydro-3-deoxy-6-phosphogalactonate aldolase n=1 Tax=Paracoccus sp. TD-10 TaxID=3395918 RepID=UPI003AADD0FD
MTQRTPLPRMRRPLVAILRGLRREEAMAIFEVLVDEGFEAIEVPLNSPDPFRTIKAAVDEFGQSALIGAGTVLEPENVDRLADIGAKLVVTPNTDPAVIGRAVRHDMIAMPGVFTPTEALHAWKSGASALKFFPAGILGVAGITAIRTVLPAEAKVAAVGGVSEVDFHNYIQAGIEIFGLGSSLYKPGLGAAEVRARAKTIIQTYDASR